MNEALLDVSIFSIFIPGIISLFRWRQFDPAYIPFVFFIWLGCLNELLGKILKFYDWHTTVSNNIYVLLASVLILWFFHRIELFYKRPVVPWLLLTILILVWCAETFFRTIHHISSYFRIVFSLATVLMSIFYINILLAGSQAVLKEGSFWICTGFIIHFTLKILVEIFWLYGIKNREFQLSVFNILLLTNIITNLTYALAALWINRKKTYSLQW